MRIDNNLVENAIRPRALGKMNWFFMENGEGGETSPLFYTLIEECCRLQINLEKYLMPSPTNHQIHTLTPATLFEHIPCAA